MYTAAAISNISYYALKKKAGLHNRGFMPRRELSDFEMEDLENDATGAGAFEEFKEQGE